MNAQSLASTWTVWRRYQLVGLLLLSLLAGCDNSSSKSSTNLDSPFTPIRGANTQPITINSSFPSGYINDLLTSVLVCVPGTALCQNIPNVLVDTGSSGLRILRSQLTLQLPPVFNNNATPLGECTEFVDSFVWGPVVTADVMLANQRASGVPIQLIGSDNFAAPPGACTSSGLPPNDTVETLGANGILGIGLFAFDCGVACSPQSPAVPAIYFNCPDQNSPCTPTAVALANQVQNPVSRFLQHNNGVIISLPPIAESGASSVSGTLVLGIGTAGNNTLGNAKIYQTDIDGTFVTTYKGIDYPGSYLDTGTSVLAILDAATLGVPECASDSIGSGAYCPAATVRNTATTRGVNGTTGAVDFRIANANTLLRSNNWAFDDFAIPFGATPPAIAWGTPFFFGRNVFIAIEDQDTPGGVGPYWAY